MCKKIRQHRRSITCSQKVIRKHAVFLCHNLLSLPISLDASEYLWICYDRNVNSVTKISTTYRFCIKTSNCIRIVTKIILTKKGTYWLVHSLVHAVVVQNNIHDKNIKCVECTIVAFEYVIAQISEVLITTHFSWLSLSSTNLLF